MRCSFLQKSFNRAKNANNYCQHIWEYLHIISQKSKEHIWRYVHLFQGGGITFVELFSNTQAPIKHNNGVANDWYSFQLLGFAEGRIGNSNFSGNGPKTKRTDECRPVTLLSAQSSFSKRAPPPRPQIQAWLRACVVDLVLSKQGCNRDSPCTQ